MKAAQKREGAMHGGPCCGLNVCARGLRKFERIYCVFGADVAMMLQRARCAEGDSDALCRRRNERERRDAIGRR